MNNKTFERINTVELDCTANGAQAEKGQPTHLVLDSSSVSNVFCRRNSSIKVTEASFSLTVDSFVEMGGVTPRYLDERFEPGSVTTGRSYPLSKSAIVVNYACWWGRLKAG